MALALGNGASHFTIDGGHANNDSNTPGIDMGPSSFSGHPGPQYVTITRVAFGSGTLCCSLEFRAGVSGNNVLDHDIFHNAMGAEAYIRFTSGGGAGTTVQYSLFRDGSEDGLKIGAPNVTSKANEFFNLNPYNTTNHTDAVQLFGGDHDKIIGNFVHGNCSMGIDAFDGTSSNTIEDNVVEGCTGHSIVMSGDDPGSTVAHNTTVPAGGPGFECTSKSGSNYSTTQIKSNVFPDEKLTQSGTGIDCHASLNANNLLAAGGSPPNLSGSPSFVGGAHPTTYAGFALAPGSPGRNAAGDGSDLGARVNLYPRSGVARTGGPAAPGG